ncbi:MAG: glycosyltransferase family 39 protein [Crocinitomicaceae bacterium]|nr:glycosyltransferase family 39 protein [Crocinitomicaceae bacterium]
MIKHPYSYIFLFCLLCFVPFLGSYHLFDWDEINFAECAREMIITGNYSTVQINFEAFWEKPPLFIWMQVISMKVFGINEFAARFPNVIASIFTLFSLFFLGKKIANQKLAIWWTILYAGSYLPNIYFHSGIIDPWFNLFIFSAIACFYIANQHKDSNTFLHYFISGLLAGLAILTKGPVALLIIGASLGIWLIFNRFKNMPSALNVLCWCGVLLLIGCSWFILLFIQGNESVVYDFITYQIRLFQTGDAGHSGPFYYHFIVLLIGCIPASFLALKIVLKKQEKTSFIFLMQILFWFTLILFTIVKTKIIHYSSLCYLPLTYMGAYYLINTEKNKISKWILNSISLVNLLISLLLISLTYILITGKLSNYISLDDPFAVASLNANVSWSMLHFIPGFALLIGAVFAFYYRVKSPLKSLSIIIVSQLILIFSLKMSFVSNVEQYSQGAAIEFYENNRGEGVVFVPLGLKSYAHLFYGDAKPINQKKIKKKYAISKIQDKKRFLEHDKSLKVIGEKNGFVFYLIQE